MKKPKITEAEFQKQVIQLARLRGFKVAHFRCVRIMRSSGKTYYETPVQADGTGFMDLILANEAKKLLIAAELKVPPNKCSPQQTEWLNAFASAGVPAYVWTPDDWPEIEKVLS